MTEHFNAEQVAGAFFATYAEALLRRDADAIAEHYATPALIEFPQAAIPVSERAQTRDFFETAFAQYRDVTQTYHTIKVAACGPHSIWADVSWNHHGGAPDERLMYQLTHHEGTWRIAVLTPLSN